MAAPTLIAWDTNNRNILIPDAGHIANGWVLNEKPTGTNHNWMFQNIFQWIAYLGAPIVTDFVAQTTVTINHNRGRQVVVVVTDTAGGLGNIIGPDNVQYATLNQVVVTFGGNQTGSITIF